MITLVLVRHAKSDWADLKLPDHERPLNARGRRDAPRMAQQLADSGVNIDRVLSSTAVRARSTAAEFARALGVEMSLDPELYASSASTMMRAAAASGAEAVLLVAHDPGITYLAERLSAGGIGHMPTCAVARFTWNVPDWSSVEWDEVSDWSLDTPR